MSDLDAFDLMRELDPARGRGIPGPRSTTGRRIRTRIAAEAGHGHRRSPVRVFAVATVVLLLVTGVAIAATVLADRSAVLRSEGRDLVVGSEQSARTITFDDAAWSVVRYTTTDGYTCLDSDLTVGGTFRGSIGGCQVDSEKSLLSAGVGGVWDSESFRLLLTGGVAPIVARVSITDDLGRVLVDQPVDGIWVIVPVQGASSWTVEAFDVNGNRVGRVDIKSES